MSLDEKLEQKLRPHAERVEMGNPNDYDYLPAVLFSCIDSNKKLHQSMINNFEQIQIALKNENIELSNKINKIHLEQELTHREVIKQLKINHAITTFLSIVIIITIVLFKK